MSKINSSKNKYSLYPTQTTPKDKHIFTIGCPSKHLIVKSECVFISMLFGNYFNANVYFEMEKTGSKYTISNIVIKDVRFKNEANVSVSDKTNEYKYLYNVSCSSASSACVRTNPGATNSISTLINKNTEKAIYTAVKKFLTNPKKFYGLMIRDANTWELIIDIKNTEFTQVQLKGSAKFVVEKSHDSLENFKWGFHYMFSVIIFLFVGYIFYICKAYFVSQAKYFGLDIGFWS